MGFVPPSSCSCFSSHASRHTALHRKQPAAFRSTRHRPRRAIGIFAAGGPGPAPPPGGAVARLILARDIPIPRTESATVKSGYLVAPLLATLLGGGTIAASFLPFLALALSVEAPPSLAALVAALTSLAIDLLRVNVSAAVGLPSASGVLGPAAQVVGPLAAFAVVVGVTVGLEGGAAEPPAATPSEELQRRKLRERVRRRQEAYGRIEGGTGEKEERFYVSEDLQRWDEKFMKERPTEDRR